MGEEGSGVKEIDTKRYAKIEKIPGGTIEESRVLDGVMFNKDVTHPKGRTPLTYDVRVFQQFRFTQPPLWLKGDQSACGPFFFG